MKYNIAIILFLFCCGLSFAQNRYVIDSIKTELRLASEDSTRVMYLDDIVAEFYNYNTDSILYYSKKIESIANSSGNLDYQAVANHHFGTALLNQSNYQEAVELYESNIHYYAESGQDAKAISAHFNLAVAYSELGDLELSADHYFKVLEHYRENGDLEGAANVYNGLAITYETFQEYDQAIGYYHKGLHLLGPAYDDKIDKANIYSNLADLYLTLGEIDSTKQYIEEALRINIILDLKWGLGYSYAILSAVALAENQPELALQHANTSMSYRKTDGSPTEVAESHLALGKAYHELKQFAEAETHYSTALDLSSDREYLTGIEDAAGVLASLYEEKGNYIQSLKYFKIQSDAKDSLLQEDKLISLNALQYKFEAAQKEKEISQQELKIQKQNQLRTYLIAGLIFLSLIILFIYYRYRKNRALTYKELQLQKERIASLQKEKQLSAVAHVVEEQVKDRRQIATHLLDSLGAVLASSRMKLQRLKTEQDIKDPSELVLQTDELIRNASSEIRRIAQEMMPEALIHLGLPAAISDLCYELQSSTQIEIEEKANLNLDLISEQQEVMMFNIVNEILQHLVTSTNATAISLAAHSNENAHIFEISANESARNLDQQTNEEPLLGAKAQIKYLGGEMKVGTRSGGGRMYSITLPI